MSVFRAVRSPSACATAASSLDSETRFSSASAFSIVDAALARSHATALAADSAYCFSITSRFSAASWSMRRDSACHHRLCSSLSASAARYLRISESCRRLAASRSNREAASFAAIAARSSAISRSTVSMVFSRPAICAFNAMISASCVFFSDAISVSARSFSASYEAALPANTESSTFLFFRMVISRWSVRTRVS
jgi:hypothetical protein